MSLIGINNNGKPLININLRDLKNIPQWLKILLYTSIVIGVFYFMFLGKYGANIPKLQEICEFKECVNVLNKKVSNSVTLENYKYDKKQVLLIFNVVKYAYVHIQTQEEMEINILIQYIQNNNKNSKDIINQLNELKNNNQLFYNNYIEEINQIEQKYYNENKYKYINNL